MTRVKLLLADDHEIVREGLRSLLGARRDFEIVGEAADGREAVALVEELKPDIVILDISMPLLNGLEATRQILKMRPQTKVLILTMHESDSLVRDILNVGARGYILKTDVGKDLVTAVESLHRKKTFFTSSVSQMVLDGYLKGSGSRSSNSDSEGTRLTPRQREVVQLVAEGKSSKEVAVALDLSVKTAETHRTNIIHRLGLHSVAELVRYAVRNEIIQA